MQNYNLVSYPMDTRGSSLRGKPVECAANHSLPSSAEVKNYRDTPPLPHTSP
jgi:hypothetical protein